MHRVKTILKHIWWTAQKIKVVFCIQLLFFLAGASGLTGTVATTSSPSFFFFFLSFFGSGVRRPSDGSLLSAASPPLPPPLAAACFFLPLLLWGGWFSLEGFSSCSVFTFFFFFGVSPSRSGSGGSLLPDFAFLGVSAAAASWACLFLKKKTNSRNVWKMDDFLSWYLDATLQWSSLLFDNFSLRVYVLSLSLQRDQYSASNRWFFCPPAVEHIKLSERQTQSKHQLTSSFCPWAASFPRLSRLARRRSSSVPLDGRAAASSWR